MLGTNGRRIVRIVTSARARQATNGFGYRLVSIRLFIALVVLCAGFGASASVALAGWGRTVVVHGPAIQKIVFDAHDMPWVFSKEPGGPAFIARLTSAYRFENIQMVPNIPNEELNGVNAMAVNTYGVGDLLLEYFPTPRESGPSPNYELAPWDPGHKIGRPLELTRSAFRGPSIAINPRGTADVLWASEHKVFVDRIRSGHLLDGQQIEIAEGRVPNSMEVLTNPAGEFLASWELRTGRDGIQLVAVDNDVASPTGIFREPVLTQWSAHVAGAGEVSEATLVTNVHGDQVAVWRWSIPAFRGGHSREEIYVTSRRAGESFSAQQFMGETEMSPNPVSVVLGPTGRITVGWRPFGSRKILVATGHAGRRLGTARKLWVGKPGESASTPLVVVTSRNQVVASWTVQRGSTGTTIVAATSNDGLHFSRPQRISIGGRYIHNCEGSRILVPAQAGGAFAGWSCEYRRYETVNEYARFWP
jgi:hypothetical protein